MERSQIITDAKADFRHVIIVMTTNAGAEMLDRNTMGFSEQDNQTDGLQAIKTMFAPEFRNRLDAVVTFNSLTPEVISKVVTKTHQRA